VGWWGRKRRERGSRKEGWGWGVEGGGGRSESGRVGGGGGGGGVSVGGGGEVGGGGGGYDVDGGERGGGGAGWGVGGGRWGTGWGVRCCMENGREGKEGEEWRGWGGGAEGVVGVGIGGWRSDGEVGWGGSRGGFGGGLGRGEALWGEDVRGLEKTGWRARERGGGRRGGGVREDAGVVGWEGWGGGEEGGMVTVLYNSLWMVGRSLEGYITGGIIKKILRAGNLILVGKSAEHFSEPTHTSA